VVFSGTIDTQHTQTGRQLCALTGLPRCTLPYGRGR